MRGGLSMSFTDWKQTTIGNTFMFRLVMEKQELCKPLIERVLGTKINTIVYAEPEKSFEAKLASKGIRLDLYAVDENGVAYDVEMQMSGDLKEFLGKRSRYYVSLMDNDALKKASRIEIYVKPTLFSFVNSIRSIKALANTPSARGATKITASC